MLIQILTDLHQTLSLKSLIGMASQGMKAGRLKGICANCFASKMKMLIHIEGKSQSF
jgi:hypothetical protein